MLNSRSDCNALAREVLSQCDLIHPSRLVEVEQTIYYLKKRKVSQQNNMKGEAGLPEDLHLLSNSYNYLLFVDADGTDKSGVIECEGANINYLNEYIELLYEGVADKIKASSLILQLARDPENLDSLSKNGNVIIGLLESRIKPY